MAPNLLEVKNLSIDFQTPTGTLKAVREISFDVPEGTTVGLVGESGCGKSVTALSLMGLVPRPQGKVSGDGIFFEGKNLLTLPPGDLRRLRGDTLAMVFQEPMTSLNPVLTIGDQVTETLLEHRSLSKKEAWAQGTDLLNRVHIPRPDKIMTAYPHELSGGMLQRVMIASAMGCEPRLLLADEPTTALDVTIQAQILELFREWRDHSAMTTLLITHDFGVIAELADHVAVMYAGRVVETAPAADLFRDPRHPYTRGLLHSRPRIGQRTRRLPSIPGQVPSLVNPPPGCLFADRCPVVSVLCRQVQPLPVSVGPGHTAACFQTAGSPREAVHG